MPRSDALNEDGPETKGDRLDRDPPEVLLGRMSKGKEGGLLGDNGGIGGSDRLGGLAASAWGI